MRSQDIALLEGEQVAIEVVGTGKNFQATVSAHEGSVVRLALPPDQRAEISALPETADLVLTFLRAGVTYVQMGARILPEITIGLDATGPQPLDQIRSEFRLSLSVDTRFRVVGDAGPAQGWKRGQLLDVSGGGVRLQPAENDPGLQVGRRVELRFTLPNTTDVIESRADVVRTGPSQTGRGADVAGLKFSALDQKTKDGIERWVFAEQLRRRRSAVN